MLFNNVNIVVLSIIVLLSANITVKAERSTKFRSVIPVVRLWPGDPPATQPFDKPDTGERLYRNGPKGHGTLILDHITHAWLSAFMPANAGKSMTAVIICPGGGYSGEAIALEGFDVARRFNNSGVAAFVLKYRLPHGIAPAKDALPMPQQDVLRAIQVVRSRAAEWHINPNRIGVVGFSAGGNVAACAATMFNDANMLPAHDAISHESGRPDFAVLMYAVISMEPGVGHAGSRANLIGKDASPAVSKRFSANEQMSKNVPPLFIAQAKDDRTVPFHNAEMMAAAAQKYGVPHEFISFKHGGHGFGLGDNAETRTWFPRCISWMESQHLLKAH